MFEAVSDLFKKEQPKNLTLKSTTGWGGFLSKTMAGSVVSPEQAMRITAVYACVRIIAEGIASTPLHLYQNRPEGGKDRANTHALSVVFGGIPNEENTTQELLEYVIASLLLHGNSYCQVIRRAGRVVSLEPLDPTCMTPRRTDSGVLVFDYRANGGELVTYQKGDLWRVCGLSSDGVNGYSPIRQAREALGVSVSAERHAAQTFSNGASIPGVFEIDKALTDEGFVRLQEQINSQTGNLGSMMKPMLLEDGLSYKSISMTLADAQFIESRKFQIAEIARMFSVPLHKLAELDKSSFNNIEHQSLEMVRDTFRPWCTRIEQTIRRDLLTQREKPLYFAKFNLEGLLRGDTKTRYDAHASSLNNGWKCVNEVREVEDMNPIEGGDVYRIPLNMGEAGEIDAEPAAESGAAEQLDALITRQVNAIRREKNRADFSEWVADYYDRLAVAIVSDELDAETAEKYCQKQLKDIKAADDVEALLTKWESE